LGDIVEMSIVETGGEWFSSFPGSGRIYRLIDAAQTGNSGAERLGAVVALGASGDPRAVRTLIACLGDNDPSIRLYAVGSLARLKSCRAVDALIGRLHDRNERSEIRMQAAAALAAIRGFSAIEGLKEQFRDFDGDPALRSGIGVLLDQLKD
jgi:HEAT repeat protein